MLERNLAARIVIVDDYDSVIEPLFEFLSVIVGCQNVETARNGQEGLKLVLAEDKPPCKLLITDLEMPEMDGKELIEIVRGRFPFITDLPIILMSGAFADPDIYPLPSGVNCLIQKPVDLDLLGPVVIHNLPIAKILLPL